MTYDDAIDCTDITAGEALAEVRDHGFEPWTDEAGNIHADGEIVAQINADGTYNGADILAWLGY